MDLIEKQRRMAILKKIDAWDKARCSKCHADSEGNSDTAIKCTCKAAVEVRNLGVEYEQGGKLKREKRIKELLSEFKDLPLSVDTYDMLKEMGVEEKFLMRHINITNAQYNEWKYSVGRSKNPPRVSSDLQEERKEYSKWRKVAEKNGVNGKLFHSRVRRDGLSYQDAVRPEPVKRMHNRSLWLDIAKSNGISYKTYKSRKGLGWSDEKAATEPVKKKEVAVR